MFALGAARLVFSLVQHFGGHEMGVIEVIEFLPFLLVGTALYVTDLHKIFVDVSLGMYKHVELRGLDAFNRGVARFFRWFSGVMYKYPELRGIEALNYFIANTTITFTQYFRKTHTGVLSYNMLAILIGAVLLAIIIVLSGGRIP
jgi:hypothetical protein